MSTNAPVGNSARDLRDQLSAHSYARSAGEFVRFRLDPEDDAVASIVRSVTSEGYECCQEFRRLLGDDDTETLRLFSMRRTLQGRRNASMSLLGEAIDAMALLPDSDDVPWDSWFKGALFVARSLGLNIDSLEERFVDLASEDAAERSYVAGEAMSRVNTLSQCQLAEVTTTYGTGFVELLVFNLTVRAGFLGNRRLPVHEVVYQPTTNLAQIAASLADALDATGCLSSDLIRQDQLAATTFSMNVAGSYIPTLGCLSFNADASDGGTSFSVIIAEFDEDTDIASLADAATSLDGQAAIFDARRLIVLSAQPDFSDETSDEEDVDVDFHDYEQLALNALRESSSPTS